MNLWAFVLGLATLFCMWLFSQHSRRYGHQARSPSDDGLSNVRYQSAHRSPIGSRVGIAIFSLFFLAMLVAVALPSFNNYSSRGPASAHLASLAQVRVTVSQLIDSARTPEAQLHLQRASDNLGNATFYLRKTGDTDISSELVKSAVFEIETAGRLEPALSNRYPTADLANDMRQLEARLASASVPSDMPNSSSSKMWGIVLLALFSLFVTAFLVAYFMLLAKHWDSKPDAATNHLRARLEPLFAFFAFVLGIALVLFPELDQAIAMWGAGISGSGVGYWLKTVGSPAGTA